MLLLLPLLFCATSAGNETSGADGLPPDCEWSTEEGHVHCRGVPAHLIENRLAGARARQPVVTLHTISHCRQAFGVTLHLSDCAQQFVDALYFMHDQRRVNALQELRIDGCPALSSSPPTPRTPDEGCLLPMPPASSPPSLVIYALISVNSTLIVRAIEALIQQFYRQHVRRRSLLLTQLPQSMDT